MNLRIEGLSRVLRLMERGVEALESIAGVFTAARAEQLDEYERALRARLYQEHGCD